MTPTTDPAPMPPSRRPLVEAAVREALTAAGSDGGGAELHLLDDCASTNEVAAQLPATATAGQGWSLVAAEQQSAGRGRLGRVWESPAGAGLLFSVLLDVPDDVPPALVGLLPLAAGVAVVDACRAVGVRASLKWPNDVVVEPGPGGAVLGKLGGLLAERSPRGVVVGVGLNVSLTAAEAPTAEATALADHGLAPDVTREQVLAACVVGIVGRWQSLLSGGRQMVLSAYRERCLTLGREVVVRGPGGAASAGVAIDVDDDGHLLLRGHDGQVSVMTAGDVVQAQVSGG